MIKDLKGDRDNMDMEVKDMNGAVIDASKILRTLPKGSKITLQSSPDNTRLSVKVDNPTADKQLRFAFDEEGNDTIVEAEDDQQATTSDQIQQAIDENIPAWILADPVMFDVEARNIFATLSEAERPRFASDLIERFYAKRPEYNTFARRTIYDNPAALLDLLKSLTLDDFKKCKLKNADLRFAALQEQIEKVEAIIEKTPLDPTHLSTIWPVLSMRELFLESELAELYYLKNPRLSSKERAQNAGAIMTTGGRLKDISYKDYMGWLDEIPNDTAYISYVGPHYWDGIEIDDGGNLYEGDEARVLRAVRTQDTKVKEAFKAGSFGDERPAGHERINKEVMRALFKATIAEKNGIRTIYLPTFARELNSNYKVDVDEYDDNGELNEKGKQNKAAADQRAKDAKTAREKGERAYPKEKLSIMQQFYSLDYWAGVLGRDEVTRTAVIVGLNKEAKTIDIVLPYLEKIKQRVTEAQEIEAEKQHRKFLIPAYNDLVHTNIDSERNKLAVDLVYTIIDKLLQRGSKTASEFKENQTDDDQEQAKSKPADEKVVYRIKYSTLIRHTPLLYMAYKNANGSKREYDVLNRTFKKTFQLLHKKTDIYDYFVDLKIPEVPPTKRTLDDELVITHRGKNPAYKKK